ncbi:MAG TPA: TetR/AcrR family transcriptional regulator [Pseudonocardiaceae bacterium]|jgi:AcrR family transcriptional regulator|nr:TetR/AcrR family transcriptional regulator [Pseudonocardiaceae bacterium]
MTATGVRLSADDRRRQLVGIGLQLLTDRPIEDVTIDEVAGIAGISRSLLFHYFPTKRDYHIAVVRAACRRLLRATEPDPGAGADEQVRATIDGFLSFVQRRREPYLALVRGRSGVEWVQPIYDEVRERLVERVIVGADGTHDGPLSRLVIRGWLALVEETALIWSRAPVGDRAAVVEYLAGALSDLLCRGVG